MLAIIAMAKKKVGTTLTIVLPVEVFFVFVVIVTMTPPIIVPRLLSLVRTIGNDFKHLAWFNDGAIFITNDGSWLFL